VWKHEQLEARHRWTRVETPAGAIPALYPPGLGSADEPRMDAVPALGQHTDAVLRELGLDDGAIERLRAANAI
jgi:crotonobetainyl-CoA:carnitine CoA-transferase CaiB-like acyl-CoA transferase